MGHIEVSTNDLMKIKTAFIDFSKDIQVIPSQIISHAQGVRNQCLAIIKKTDSAVENLKIRVKQLETQYCQCKVRVEENCSMISDWEKKISKLDSEIYMVTDRKITLEYSLRALYSQLNATDEAKAPIRREISLNESQLKIVREEEMNCIYEINTLKEKKEKLEKETSILKAENARLEEGMAVANKELINLQNKLKRLKTAYSSLEMELGMLTSVVKKFQQVSMDTSGANISGLDKCITCLEEYLNVNL